jgi:hypothetical protein
MKNNLADKQLSCDLELVFPGFTYEQFVNLVGSPTFTGYSFENKEKLGWGAVISQDSEIFVSREKLCSVIIFFLNNLAKLVEKVRSTNLEAQIILRIGIYYKTYSLTLPLDLKLIKLLQDLSVELEISTYSSSE